MINSDMRRLLRSAAMALGGALAMAAPATAQWGGSNALLYHYHVNGSFETVASYWDTCTDSGIERAPLQNIPGTTRITELYGYC